MNIPFLYHGGAFASSGKITLPVQETMEAQASLSVPLTGGHASSRVQNFRHRNYFSFCSAETHVVGSYSEKDKAYGTLAATTIEGLNIMDVVTCDRLVARLTTKHPADQSDPSFIALGSRFENLRIAGHRIEVDLATDVFAEYPTWTKLGDGKAKKDLDKLAFVPLKADTFRQPHGSIACALARNLDKLPGGLRRKGHGIYVPHFGTVYLGQYFASRNMHRLLMLHVELGCSVEGGSSAGGSDGNGGWPPSS
jgi:hypothetical protein